MDERSDELARVQKLVRGELQKKINYWDYLINRLARSASDLPALRERTKAEIAWLFINQYV